MKRAFFSLFAALCLSVSLHAAETTSSGTDKTVTPEAAFVDEFQQAYESGQVDQVLALYYKGLPEALKPVFTKMWKGALAQNKAVASYEVQPYAKAQADKYNQHVTMAGTTYARNAPAIAELVITINNKEQTTYSNPLCFVDGRYYLASWKLEASR